MYTRVFWTESHCCDLYIQKLS